eukprot:gnl/Trimastix_PCT/555.p2 GENE.gnl/Trimastix_PCT/555~~gnl/Trimastix_PCT/555.p2  ORF type:complete len:412 (+),score=185.32 gnl/Trimastix_PCT/555:53-1288(+)
MKALLILALLVFAASAKVYFQEEFDQGWESRWVKSTLKEDEGTQGKWGWEAGKFYGDAEAQKGIKTMEDARFYGISADMGEEFTNEGKDLVLQFSAKHEQNLDCGGGYIKILKAGLDQSKFGGDDGYNVMFGPDICGTGTRKVHMILNYNGENRELKKNVACKTDQLTHVYTMVLKKDNTYEILIDMEKVESGKLEEDWDLLAPKEIPDPAAKKPEDWIDEAEMVDPEDVKPEGWDVPQFIEDPEAEKPEEWDDEEDGEWKPPQVPNPDYKGEWAPKKIPNPGYKGPWKAPMIANPDYVADESLYLQKNMQFLGFELWQVKSGSIFDNIIVTDDLEEAKDFAKRTFEAYKDGEKAMFDKAEEERRAKEEAERKKMEEEAKAREAEANKDAPTDDDDDTFEDEEPEDLPDEL